MIFSGDGPTNTGVLADITFISARETTPRIVLASTNGASAEIDAFLEKTETGFKIISNTILQPNTEYQFDYISIGSDTAAQ